MLGFIQLQQQINALDYQAFSLVIRALKRLESYIREAKERRDWPARHRAEEILEDWQEAINKIQSSQGQSPVQVSNLLRTQAALKQIRAFL